MIDEPMQRLNDAVTGRTAGHFGKWNLDLTRLQHIDDRLALYLSYSRQWAEKNLDSSEKFSLGGPSGVRAIPSVRHRATTAGNGRRSCGGTYRRARAIPTSGR